MEVPRRRRRPDDDLDDRRRQTHDVLDAGDEIFVEPRKQAGPGPIALRLLGGTERLQLAGKEPDDLRIPDRETTSKASLIAMATVIAGTDACDRAPRCARFAPMSASETCGRARWQRAKRAAYSCRS
jgi:hypothetical protein